MRVLSPCALFSKYRAVDLILFVVIVCVAAWLRLYHVTLLPDGFHGDEAISGLEGEQILREGSIGVYSPLALGQPTGPLYLTALSVRLFGPTIWAVRAVSALVGTVTVGVLYLVLRRHSGGTENEKRVVALLGAAFLATFHWHLHYSRTGYPLITWPLCVLLMIWGALEAAKRKQARWWCVAGVLAGMGIYSYNAHIMCVLALGVWMLFYLWQEREEPLARRVGWLAVFVASAVVTAMPMLLYAFNPHNQYFNHAQLVSIFSAPDSRWPEMQSLGSKFGYLAGRYANVWINLGFSSEIDRGDALGVVPPVPAALLILAAVGIISGWKSKRGTLLQMSLFFVLILPLGPTITLEGLNRRVFALAPLLVFLAAVGLVEIYRRVSGGKRGTFKAAPSVVMGCVTLLFVGIVGQNLYDCFVRTLPSEPMQWTFGKEMLATCRYLNTVPSGSQVYFYSARWSQKYETRVFLVRHLLIEDRSRQFGTFGLQMNSEKSNAYFVLLDDYRGMQSALEKLYPNSEVVTGPTTSGGKPTFIAVHVVG